VLYLQSETYFHYILFYSKFVGIESSNYVIVGSAAVVGDAIGRVIRCVASIVMSATFFASMAAMSTATTTIAAETAASTTVAAISTATIGAAVESIVTAAVVVVVTASAAHSTVHTPLWIHVRFVGVGFGWDLKLSTFNSAYSKYKKNSRFLVDSTPT
jgi:hypothetical protein